MPRFVEGQDRQQVTLLPECSDVLNAEDNAVRIRMSSSMRWTLKPDGSVRHASFKGIPVLYDPRLVVRDS